MRLGQPELVQQLHCAGPRGLGDAAQLERKLDVLPHTAVREQRQRLEHHAGRPPVGRDVVDAPTFEQNVARRRLFEAGEHAHHRRLARTGRPDDGEELALVDIEIDAVDGREAAEALGERFQLKDGRAGH
jgi:hypothetical protein